MMTADVLVLDFGGVISKTLFETHALSEAALGLSAGSLTWRGPFEPDTDPLWRSMQAGEISERDYWMQRTQEVGRHVGQDWQEMRQFVQAARGADVDAVLRPEALATINAAHSAGKRLAILSNELDLFYGSDFRERIAIIEQFELVVDATYSGILKPDLRAYQFVTDGLGVDAASCVFVDDQMKNIRGGEAAGMQCVWFDVRQPQKSYNQALELLGLEPVNKE